MTFKVFNQKKDRFSRELYVTLNTRRGAFEKGGSEAMQGLFTMK